MFIMGLLTFVGVIFLLLKFSPTMRKRIIGHNGITDIGLTVGFVLLFMGTATISGMMAGIVAGVAISICLYLAKKLMSHETYNFSKREWTSKNAEWRRPASPEVRRHGTGMYVVHPTPAGEHWTARYIHPKYHVDWYAIRGVLESGIRWICYIFFGLMAVIWLPTIVRSFLS